MEGKAPIVRNKGSFESKLNQPVSFKRKAVKYPTKTTMNLYVKAVEGNRLIKIVPVVVVLALAAAALVKYGVLDRLDRVAAERAELEGQQRQLAELEGQLAGFEEVRENYQRYTKHYQTEEEAGLIDRIALLETIDSSATGLAQVSSVAISGDSATVTVTATELTQVAKYKLQLEASDYVSSASVYNANTAEDTDTGAQYVTATVVLTLAQEVSE